MAKTKRPSANSASPFAAVPVNVGALLANALRFLQTGMAGQAKLQCQRVLELAPFNADAHYLLGLIAIRAGRFEDAAASLTASLESKSTNPAAHNNLGAVLKKLNRLDDAIAHFESAISLNPDYVEAHHNLGNALRIAGRPDEAILSFEQAIRLKPDYSEAFNNKSGVLFARGRTQEALACAERAIALRSDNAQAYLNRGNILASLHRFDEALASFTGAIALEPGNAAAYVNRGGVLTLVRRHEEALADLDKALALDPNDAEALENRGNASAAVKRHAEAVQFYERLFALDPGHPFVKGNLLHARMMCSEWNGFHALSASIRTDLAAGLPAAEPFGYQGVAESEEDLLACARIFSTAEFPQAPAQSAPILSGHSGQITVGYLCGEFRQQATSILMCGVYEAHDKRRFKLIAFDNGTGDGSDYRQRIEAAFDELIDISRLGDVDVADLIRAKGVDILVNLNGYFGAGRMGVFAQRPSPIQVNYLGFPGTLGAPYIDYLIGDEIVIPADSQAFYSEKIAYLPHSYQANDAKRPVAGDLMIRADFGLPAKGFVFCCFNNNYKITPATFSSWMRILHRVEGSCLWLMQDDALVAYNLRKAAKADCISGDRLVFAGHMPLEVHLARHRLADLFLDTLPYNAHTTASDSLWAGLPVLTRTGSTFPGRVASSLLRALDMTELITASAQAYEDLAVQLATEPAILTRIRGKLQANVHTQPLFDTALFTSHLEIAYLTMFERYRSGQPPGHFHVPA